MDEQPKWSDAIKGIIDLAKEAGVESADAELTRLRARVAELEVALRPIFARLDKGDGNAPGHAHLIAGVWDDGPENGEDAGKPCEWCAHWQVSKALALEAGAPGAAQTVAHFIRNLEPEASDDRG